LGRQLATDAVTKEMKQLHDRKTIRPSHSKDLSLTDKRKALGYLMFINQKRCGAVKGREYANGRKSVFTRKKRKQMRQLAVQTESLFLSCVINAEERQNVITCDVPGAFMQVDVDKVVHVRLEEPLAE
jgi:hypothetical protein